MFARANTWTAGVPLMPVKKKAHSVRGAKRKAADSAQPTTTQYWPPIAPSVLDYQRQVLEQIETCNRLMEASKRRDFAIEIPLQEWMAALIDAVHSSTRHILAPKDIPDEPD